jgi:hypothetical protein
LKAYRGYDWFIVITEAPSEAQALNILLVASLFDIWEKELARVAGKCKTAEAIRDAIARRQSLEHFLTDGRIEVGSNIVERAIRPPTFTRKNSLFASSEGGGNTWAIIATLLPIAKMNNVNPLT